MILRVSLCKDCLVKRMGEVIATWLFLVEKAEFEVIGRQVEGKCELCKEKAMISITVVKKGEIEKERGGIFVPTITWNAPTTGGTSAWTIIYPSEVK